MRDGGRRTDAHLRTGPTWGPNPSNSGYSGYNSKIQIKKGTSYSVPAMNKMQLCNKDERKQSLPCVLIIIHPVIHLAPGCASPLCLELVLMCCLMISLNHSGADTPADTQLTWFLLSHTHLGQSKLTNPDACVFHVEARLLLPPCGGK